MPLRCEGTLVDAKGADKTVQLIAILLPVFLEILLGAFRIRLLRFTHPQSLLLGRHRQSGPLRLSLAKFMVQRGLWAKTGGDLSGAGQGSQSREQYRNPKIQVRLPFAPRSGALTGLST
jgi:hypothetical protein